MSDPLRQAVAEKPARLDALRPLDPKALRALNHVLDLELTFTSNAIEGNTLSALETTLVIEKGLTIGGKPLQDHLEALDHHDAVGYIRDLARRAATITEAVLRDLHALVVRRSQPDIAGRYAERGRYVLTERGRHAFPSPAEVPALMGDLSDFLRDAPDTPDTAFTAHRRLVAIPPFEDGNGRTARLLMNLILLRGGDPPVAVRPEDRLAYLLALQADQSGGGPAMFDALMLSRLDAALDAYLDALSHAPR